MSATSLVVCVFAVETFFVSPAVALSLKEEANDTKWHSYQEKNSFQLSKTPVEDTERWQKYIPQVHWQKYHRIRQEDCPPMMVFIMSSRANKDGRKDIRAMWLDAGAGWGVLTHRFAICRHHSDSEDPEVQQQLHEEARSHDDVTYLPCKEGYLKGRLTRKVLEAMNDFLRPSWQEHELFMKTDDDSFVSPSRLCDFLSAQLARKERFSRSYIGVFAEVGEHMYKRRPPCRDPRSPWYEPYQKFKGELYPISAKGGPGYILSRYIVQEIISQGIAEANVLANEDRAVGVWVHELLKHGTSIEYINVPGTDGYEDYHPGLIAKSGLWSRYPYAIHHHLTGSEIHCLAKVANVGHGKTHVDECFDRQARAVKGKATKLSRKHSHYFYEMPFLRRGSVEETETDYTKLSEEEVSCRGRF